MKIYLLFPYELYFNEAPSLPLVVNVVVVVFSLRGELHGRRWTDAPQLGLSLRNAGDGTKSLWLGRRHTRAYVE